MGVLGGFVVVVNTSKYNDTKTFKGIVHGYEEKSIAYCI